jgi:hypothetical protein
VAALPFEPCVGDDLAEPGHQRRSSRQRGLGAMDQTKLLPAAAATATGVAGAGGGGKLSRVDISSGYDVMLSTAAEVVGVIEADAFSPAKGRGNRGLAGVRGTAAGHNNSSSSNGNSRASTPELQRKALKAASALRPGAHRQQQIPAGHISTKDRK